MDARSPRWTLALVSAATGLLLLDVTVVNVALPAIKDDLDARFDELQWVIDAYALTLAASLLTVGSLADRLGRRAMFMAGLGAFAAASAACAAAPSALVLDLARAAQGLGAAAMFATSLALLAQEFPAGRERGVALGIWGAITGAALAVGPLVGGALVDGLGWRWIFWINLPLAGLIAFLARERVRESRAAHPGRVDWAGFVLFSTACFLLAFGLIRGNTEGFGSPLIVTAFACGVAAAVGFVRLELRTEHPALDVRLFRIPAFSGTALVAFAQAFAIYPLFLFLALWFQDVLGHTPFETGLQLLPVTLVLFAVAPLSGRLTGRVALRVPLCAALVLMGTSLLLMHGIGPGSDWTELLPGLVVGGIAIGLISPPLAAAMVSVLPVERAGLSSGINNTFRQLGIAAGIAALGAVFEHRLAAAADPRVGFADGLNAIFVIAAIVAFVAAPLAWWLLESAPHADSAATRPPEPAPSAGGALS